MENREYLNALFDIYKDLLTNIEQETFISYYVEDLSLNEIAINRGVSKSSVGKTLNNALEKLHNYETTLHNFETRNALNNILLKNDISSIKKDILNILAK